MPDPVVITRPLVQARPLADRIAALGREAIVFPLLEIHPLPDLSALRAALADLTAYSLAVFISPNAIDAAFAVQTEWPCELPLAVVGEGSRQALARHGHDASNSTIFCPRDPQRSDSEGLLAELDLPALRGRRVLLVRGESGRELMADTLRAAGAIVQPVASYRRLAPVLDQDGRLRLSALLGRRADWLITSSEALRNLVAMVRESDGDAGVVKLQQLHLVLPHTRIRETAQALGFSQITLSAAGDEGLLAALQFQR